MQAYRWIDGIDNRFFFFLLKSMENLLDWLPAAAATEVQAHSTRKTTLINCFQIENSEFVFEKNEIEWNLPEVWRWNSS